MTSGRANAQLLRYAAAHLLAVVAEWAIFIALLVYVHDREGTTAMGIASIALLAPYILVAPFAGRFAEQYPPGRVRLAGLAGQTIGYGVATLAAYGNAPTWIVVAGAMVALASVTTLRPAGAVLLPALVRSTRELTRVNLWVGHAEGVSVLLGPLLATGLLAIDGARFAIAGSMAFAAIALAVAAIGSTTGPPAASSPGELGSITHMIAAARSLAARPGAGGVLVVASVNDVVVGALDLVIVVSAGKVFDVGDAGAGLLSLMLGAGAAVSLAVNTVIVRRATLAPVLMASMVVVTSACLLYGASVSLVAALIALPLLGLSQSVLDLMARMLLQRSAPPTELGSVFALLEFSGGLGLLVGSLVAQVLIAVSGVGAAMTGIAVVCLLMLLGTGRSLRSADEGATVPVVAMSLLRLDPVFAPLPALELEAVARTVDELTFEAGETAIEEGETGHAYYVIADGRFNVSMDGDHIRDLGRGSGFGEIALLADVPRTATVAAAGPARVLRIDRRPFLIAVTGFDASRQAAWGAVRTMDLRHLASDVLAAELPDSSDR